MKEQSESKKNETESKKPTSPATAPKSPKLPTPETPAKPEIAEAPKSQPESKSLQENQADLQSQAPHQDLQFSKKIENGPIETSQKTITVDSLKTTFGNIVTEEQKKDLDLLKNPTPDKPKDDLQILDTKPGLVEKQELKGNEQQDSTQSYTEAFHDELVFSKVLDPNERKHFQIIIKQQKESAGSLRRQVQALVAYIGTLPETEDSKALLESLSTL